MHRRVTAIARKELRQRIRDRSAIILVLVAPLLIAAIMSGAFKGAESFHYSLGVVNADRGPVGASVVASLDQPGIRRVVHVVHLASPAAARRAVLSGAVSAALVIPPGFSSSLHGIAPEPLVTDTSVNNQLAASTTAAIVRSFAAQLNADRLSIATAVAAGAPRSSIPRLERLVAAWRLPLSVIDRPVGARQLTPISYFAPAMAIFFLLFQVTFTARSYFADVATGMVDRMRVAPVRPAEIIMGKALAAFTLSLASLAIIAVATTLLFGASWGSPLPVALLAIAISAAVACICALVIVVSKSQRQAEGIGSLVAFGLALVGGNFVMISALSPFMRRLALWTPNGWAMRGFTDLSTIGGGVRQVAAPLLALAAFTAVLGGASVLLAGRAVRR